MKKSLLSLSLLVLVGTYSWLYFFLRSDLVEIPIKFSDAFYPLVNLQIEGQEYPVELALSAKYPAFLNRECLEGLQKRLKGEARWNQLDGGIYSAPLYELPHTHLGTLQLENLLTAAEDDISNGSVGSLLWPFEKGNLVLDYPHRAVWKTSTARDLRSLGLDPARMLKVKTEKGPKKDIIIPVMTELGELRMSLSTRCNGTLISDQLLRGEALSTSLIIEGQDYGLEKLHPFPIPDALGVDGFLGTTFFLRHMVYIDQANACLYIGEETGNTLDKKTLTKLPIQFTCNNLPLTDFKMSKATCKALIDLGSSREISLTGVTFDPQDFHHLETATFFNMWGEKAEEHVYSYPMCTLGSNQLRHIEFSRTGPLNYSSGIEMEAAEGSDSSLEYHANVGRPILNRSNLYFDFPNAAVYLVDREDKLKKLKVDLTTFNKIPYAFTSLGIGMDVWVDGQRLHFFLDTGTSASCINTTVTDRFLQERDKLENVCYLGKSFRLGEHDYGEQILYPIELGPRWEYDGILGMDFLRQHPFYIDHPNRVIYFQRPSS